MWKTRSEVMRKGRPHLAQMLDETRVLTPGDKATTVDTPLLSPKPGSIRGGATGGVEPILRLGGNA